VLDEAQGVCRLRTCLRNRSGAARRTGLDRRHQGATFPSDRETTGAAEKGGRDSAQDDLGYAAARPAPDAISITRTGSMKTSLPKGFHRIRHYERLANGARAANLTRRASYCASRRSAQRLQRRRSPMISANCPVPARVVAAA